MAIKYDVVYYWAGGMEVGRWCEATGDDLDAVVASIEKAGRVAYKGVRNIGAPEGPPSEAQFRAIGFIACPAQRLRLRSGARWRMRR